MIILKYTKIFSFIILSLLSQISLSKEKTLKIVAAYLSENTEQDGKTGRDIMIMKTILKCAGYRVIFDVQPYMRHLKSYLTNETYDGVSTIPESDHEIQGKSKPYIAYNNGVFVKDSEFPNGIRKLDDLKGKDVISFTGGKKLLKGLTNKVQLFASYTESSTQNRHNEMLMRGRVSGVFTDALIFMAHQRRLVKNEPRWQNVKIKFYRIFHLNHFTAAFRDPEITNKFNVCLKKLNKNGDLNTIERSFADKYHDSLGSEFLNPLLRN